MSLKSKLGFRSKNEGKNIPPEIMLEFEEIEKEVLESNGKENPYSIIWQLARKHAGFEPDNSKSDAGEQPAQDSQLDKLSTGGQNIQSGDANTSSTNVDVTSIPTGNLQDTKRGIFKRFFGRKK